MTPVTFRHKLMRAAFCDVILPLSILFKYMEARDIWAVTKDLTVYATIFGTCSKYFKRMRVI